MHRLHTVPAPSGKDTCVVHLDLHPDNVMMTSRGPVVIDWRDAREGKADLDLATTCVIFGSVAVSRSGPFAELARSARAFVDAFVPLVADRALLALDEAVELRRRNPNLDEIEREDVRRSAELVRSLAA